MWAQRHHGAPGRVVFEEIDRPEPGRNQVLVEILACGVCRTDLHVVDGELPGSACPVVPGHEAVGRVIECGDGVEQHRPGDRVGLPWLAWVCGRCDACRRGQENLCARARFRGHNVDGGFAEYAVAEADHAFALPDRYDDVHVAPLLCAGLIGHRALRRAGDAGRLGLYGFGASAHIVAQIAREDGREVFAFTRPGDTRSQAFARGLGAVWAGGSDEPSPEPLDAAILFAPVGSLIPQALGSVRTGGRVVCAGIHMSDVPSFPYALLFGEREVASVAHLTRQDAREFLERAARTPLEIHTHVYGLADAQRALDDLRAGRFDGAAVLVPERISGSRPATVAD
jgi:propanol-preferring alcohol dehydrogenase